MWYELFVITASGLGVSIFLIYLLAAQIMPFLRSLPMTLIEGAKQEFGLTSGAGGRPNEGFMDKILAIPGVQSYIGNLLNKMGGQMGGQGGMGGMIGP